MSDTHVAVERTKDRKITVPEGMSLEEAAQWCYAESERLEREYRIHEPIRAFPLDGAYAFIRALREIYGWVDMRATPGFFGSKPPTMRQIEVNFNEYERVPWGRLTVPGFDDGHFETSIDMVDGKASFVIGGIVKNKFKEKVDELVAVTKKFASEGSIYRGKAFRITFPDSPDEFDLDTHTPKFMDFSAVKEDSLIFPGDLQQMVEVALFTPIEQSDACRAHKIPLKRGILLEGPPGTGKTLTTAVIAHKAQKNGWTYVAVDDVRFLPNAIRFARDFQPAIVVVEDIDRVDPSGKRNDAMNMVLNTLDGPDIKGSEIMVVTTTNNIDLIRPEMLRPGRIDAVIPVRPPDALATRTMLEKFTAGTLAIGEDLTDAATILAGEIPAVIREVAERSKMAAIRRTKGSSGERVELLASDVEVTARGMKNHLAYLKPRVDDKRSDLEKAADIVANAMMPKFDVGHVNGTGKSVTQ